MNDVIWEDPPMSGVRGRYDAFFAELRANPGRWGRYPGGPVSPRNTSLAAALRKRNPDLEVVIRTTVDGEKFLFARCTTTGQA